MTTANAGSPLRQRMIDDMVARKLALGTQRGHIFARELLKCPPPPPEPEPIAAATTDEPRTLPSPCPCCGGRMHVIETFEAGTMPRHRPSPTPIAIRIDTS